MIHLSYFSHAQNDPDTLLAQDNRMIPLPTISVNFGIDNLLSDVALEKEGPSAYTQFGYQLGISQQVAKFLNITFRLHTGSVYGEEQRDSTNLNFRTTLFSQNLNLEYNFYPLFKPKANGRQAVQPYIGFGVGMIYFRSKGDLKDNAGTSYQYWSDGSVRAEVEGTVDPTESTILERDFEYETDLRDANLDGLRKYPQLAFSLPINAGIRFQITKNFGLNAGFTYAMNFSDMLDNVSSESIGERQGDAGSDKHFYGSLGLTFFLGRIKPSSKPQRFKDQLATDKTKSDLEKIKSDSLAEQNSDSQNGQTETDIVQTSIDETSNSAKKDDEAKHGDQHLTESEIGSESGNKEGGVQNPLGKNHTEQASASKLHSENKPVAKQTTLSDIEASQQKPNGDFHWADLNKNGWISPEEVLHFLDLLFEGEPDRKVGDIQNLIDYYFEQE